MTADGMIVTRARRRRVPPSLEAVTFQAFELVSATGAQQSI